MTSIIAPISSQTVETNLGGPYNGFSAKQTVTNFKSSEQAMTRKILRSAWNTPYATGTYNGNKRAIGEFRAVNNLGDFLNRQNYSCGGSNQVNLDKPGRGQSIGSIPQQCDATGVPASICNTRFVPDSSDYIRYRKQRAMNQNYNDLKNGGNRNNADYVPLMHVRRY